MTSERVRAFLANLPPGVTELYVHPATETWPGAFPPDYDFAGEFAALVDPAVAAAAAAPGIQRVSFSELSGGRL